MELVLSNGLEHVPQYGRQETRPRNVTPIAEGLYVGETGRTLKQGITQHKRAVKTAESNNGLAVHVARTKHEVK